MITRNGALTVPIVALDKRLRDGRRLVLTVVADGALSYRMRAELNGEVVSDRFTAPVRRNATPVAGLPHAINVPIERAFRPVGLTDAEADQIEAATREWQQRRARLAREAAPDAHTWKVRDLPSAMPVGCVMEVASQPVMVLGRSYRDIEDDGTSFGLPDDSGTLITVTVRALTDDESLEWRQMQERQAEVAAAHDKLFTPRGEPAGLFGWPRHGEQLPADATACERADIPTDGRRTLYLDGPWALIHAGGSIYCHAVTGEAGAGTVRHPATPERLAVFETLIEAADSTGFLHSASLQP